MKKITLLIVLTLIALTNPLLAEDKAENKKEPPLPSIKDTQYGDWMLRVSADPSKNNLNHIFTASKSKDGQYTLDLGVLYNEIAKDWVVVYRFNPTADKEKGVEISFPSNIKGYIPILGCNDKFCQAEINKNTIAFLEYLKNNPKGTLTFIDKEKGNISMPFSLKGFNKAFEELQKTQKPSKKAGSTPEAKPEEVPDNSARD